MGEGEKYELRGRRWELDLGEGMFQGNPLPCSVCNIAAACVVDLIIQSTSVWVCMVMLMLS